MSSTVEQRAKDLQAAREALESSKIAIAEFYANNPELCKLEAANDEANLAEKAAKADFVSELTEYSKGLEVKTKGVTPLVYGATAKAFKYVYDEAKAVEHTNSEALKTWADENMTVMVKTETKEVLNKKAFEAYLKEMHLEDAVPDFVKPAVVVSVPNNLDF